MPPLKQSNVASVAFTNKKISFWIQVFKTVHSLKIYGRCMLAVFELMGVKTISVHTILLIKKMFNVG